MATSEPTLPPRFNPDAVCPKCGHACVSVQYKALSGSGHQPNAERMRTLGLAEWMSRQCAQCKYVWDELPLDTTVIDA